VKRIMIGRRRRWDSALAWSSRTIHCICKGPSGNRMRSGYTFCPHTTANSIVSTQNFRHRPSGGAWQDFGLRQIGMASAETTWYCSS
jgi:hypothetical protein